MTADEPQDMGVVVATSVALISLRTTEVVTTSKIARALCLIQKRRRCGAHTLPVGAAMGL